LHLVQLGDFYAVKYAFVSSRQPATVFFCVQATVTSYAFVMVLCFKRASCSTVMGWDLGLE